MRKTLAALALLASTFTAHAADTANLQKAVDFVLTDSDKGDNIEVLDAGNCIFRTKDGFTVYLNNIKPDEILWKRDAESSGGGRNTMPVITYEIDVVLSGKGVVKTPDGRTPDKFTFVVASKWGSMPEINLDRHKRAWAWLYSEGGCKPYKPDTPF